MTSLVEVEWYELWNGEERGMTWIVELYKTFLVTGENIKINLFIFSFFEVNIRYKCHVKVQ